MLISRPKDDPKSIAQCWIPWLLPSGSLLPPRPAEAFEREASLRQYLFFP